MAGEESPQTSDTTSTPASPTTVQFSIAQPLLLGFVVVAGAGTVYGVTAAGGIPAAAQAVQDFAQDSGDLGPLVFALAYIIATVVLIPASVLTLAAGYLFGPIAGTAIVSVSSTLGAAAAFLVSRYLARPWVLKALSGFDKLDKIDAAVARQGGRIVLLLRLSPLVPFTLLNYALGLTQVGFWPYIGASWLGMLPGTFAYVYLGGVGKAAADAASSAMSEDGASEATAVKVTLYVVGAAATLLATRYISKSASEALEEASAEEQPLIQDASED